jgi:prepilin-type processing-associated H-X9-DG protein
MFATMEILMRSIRSEHSQIGEISCRAPGFTVVELLALITAIVILAGALLPALAMTRPRTVAAACMVNKKRLSLAVKLYAADNKDVLVASVSDGTSTVLNGAPYPAYQKTRPVWVSGWLADFSNPSNTNASLITNGPLFKYADESQDVYKCPADLSVIGRLPQWPNSTPRIRSASMNQAFDFGDWLPATEYRTYAKESDIVIPAHTFVFMDEHPDSINDASLAVAMIPSGAVVGALVDIPSALHDGAAAVSFADGHVELHRWLGGPKGTKQPVTYGGGNVWLNIQVSALGVDPGSFQDALWLSENTTVRR